MSNSMSSPKKFTLTVQARIASDLMAPQAISIHSEASVAEAMLLFSEKQITAAPVIDPEGHPIGVVSRSDLLIHQSEYEKQHKSSGDTAATRPTKESTVAELMTPAVFAVSPDTPIQRVISDMVGLHVHRLFVVNETGALVGVITPMDILKHLVIEE